MSNQLSLLIPGLLTPPQSLQQLSAEDKPVVKILNRFFSRAKPETFPAQDYYPTLFHLFGLANESDKDHPIAAVTYLADSGEQHADWTLRCDPAYILADMDRAVLMGHGALGLSREESEQLVMIINAHVEQDGWQIEAHAIDRWYVKGTDKNNIRTTPPQSILGQDIKHDLPKGGDAGYWCSIMNECQMLLHDLPVNIARQERGVPPVNSLWFWGGGELPEKANSLFDKVFTDDPLVSGLCLLSHTDYASTDTLWQDMEQHDKKHYLLVIDDLIEPQINGDLFAWLDVVKNLEPLVIEKLINMLKQKKLDEVTLYTADGSRFTLTPKRLRHWWKRSTGFTNLLEQATK